LGNPDVTRFTSWLASLLKAATPTPHTGVSEFPCLRVFKFVINLMQGFFLGEVAPPREYWLLAFVYGAPALAHALSDHDVLHRDSAA
jgi:hypothetical protein